MSGLEVVGGISAVVGIIGGAYQLWEGARKDIKFSETFVTVAAQLPILRDTLQTCHDQLKPIQDKLPSDVVASLLDTINCCKRKAANLQQIFQETIPTEDDQWYQKYCRVFSRLGAGNKVEELMDSIIQDAQLLVNLHAVKSARPDLSTALEKLKSKLESMEPSISGHKEIRQTFNAYGGQQNNSTGDSTQYISSNTGPGTTHNYGGIQGNPTFQLGYYVERDNFQYIKPYGDQISQAPDIGRKLFIGRRAELNQIHQQLVPSVRYKEQRRVVLGGIGGIGKTQLAITYAKEHTGEGGYSSIFWLNATSETTLEDSFRTIASIIFDVQSSEAMDRDNLRARVHQWLSDPTNTAWLLIFDNHDDPDAFDIRPYYPPASHGAVLITSRRSDLVLATEIRVPPLRNIEESLDLLQQRSGLMMVHQDLYARHLAERLGGLPLALATAGLFLSKSRLTFADYLNEYEKRWNPDPRGRTVKLREYQLGLNDEERTLYTTWNISYTRLEAEDADASQLLKLCAYFDHQQLWYELFHAGLSQQPDNEFHKILAERTILDSITRTLVDYGFLELNDTSQLWSMHACVHDWTLAVLNKDISATHYWYAFDSVTTLINQIEWDTLGYLVHAPLAPHAARLVSQRFCQVERTDEILSERCHSNHKAAEFLVQQLQIAAGEKMYQRALQSKEKTWGAEHPSTLKTVSNLGSLYFRQGKIQKAEEMYQRALQGREKTWGVEHPFTLKTVNNLGSLYFRQGKIQKAEEMYQRALQSKEKALGMEHPSTLDIVSNLGDLYQKQGKKQEAEKMYQRALQGREKIWNIEHPSTLNTVHSLGTLYRKQGKMQEAEEMYQRALQGKEKAWGTEHPITLDTVSSLGNLYLKQGKMQEAEEMYQWALRVREKAWGAEHPSTLDTVNNLGILYQKQGKLQEAEEIYQQVLHIKEKTLGMEHPFTLDTVNNLGNLYWKQGKTQEAEKIYWQVLQGKEKAWGVEHPSTLSTVNKLLKLYRKQNKTQEVEKMYWRALRGKEKVWGAEHPSTLDTVNNLGVFYEEQGRMKEAEGMYQRALQGKDKAQGPEHMSTLRTVVNLGTLYVKLSRLGDMIAFVSVWGSKRPSLFGMLGRMLLQNSDDSNAQVAFQCQFFTQDSSLVLHVRCDGCGGSLTQASGRAVCRRCIDVDLCQDCLNKHRTGTQVLPTCVDHLHFEVASASSLGPEQTSLLQEVQIVSWFQQLALQLSPERVEDCELLDGTVLYKHKNTSIS